MVTIKLREEDFLSLLLERVYFWECTHPNIDLFEEMYSRYIENGVFNDREIDVASIVDNDVINYTSVLEKGDEDFREVLELYKQGKYDISCETAYSFIEAVSGSETRILVRW